MQVPLEHIHVATAAAYVLAVALVDVRTHKIPNVLCAVAVVTGLCLQLAMFGWHGFLAAAGGVAVGLCLFLPFYVLRAFGAGDVKAMAAAGAFLGVEQALVAVALTLIAGSVIGAVVLRARSPSTASALYRLIGVVAVPLSLGRAMGDRRVDEARERFPYGAAIAVGVLATLFWSGRIQTLN
jgi:prepilin peptidase CpaA